MQTFIFIGRSGCGKGTQAKLLEEYLKTQTPQSPVYYLETGQSFRDFLESGTYSATLARRVNEEGGLQPEFLAVWAWSHLLVENLTGEEHLIIDGTPRRLAEAVVLDGALSFYNRKTPVVVHVSVSREWSKERLLGRHRSDDALPNIEKRLAWFDTEVLPAIEYFRSKEKYHFIEVNGEQPIADVHRDILAALPKESR